MKPQGRKVSAKESAALLAGSEHRIDPEMSAEVMCRAYVLADGRALLVLVESAPSRTLGRR